MTSIVILSLFLEGILGGSNHSFTLIVNRVPIGQIDQPIHSTRSDLGCGEIKKNLRKHRVKVAYDSYEFATRQIIKTDSDSTLVHHGSLRNLYTTDLETLDLVYEPSHFLYGSGPSDRSSGPRFDSLYYLLADTAIVKCVPSFNGMTMFYMMNYFDPSVKYGKDICLDYFNVYTKYLAFTSFLPTDSVNFCTAMKELQLVLIPFIKKYPSNPYCFSIFFFLNRSFTASLKYQAPKSYFDDLFRFISDQDELYDKTSISFVESLLKGYHKKFNISRSESEKIFRVLSPGKPDSRNRFSSIYSKFLLTLK